MSPKPSTPAIHQLTTNLLTPLVNQNADPRLNLRPTQRLLTPGFWLLAPILELLVLLELLELLPLSSRFQHVPDSADIVNKGLIEWIVDLRSQAAHRRFHNIRTRIKVDIPNLFDNSGARDDFAR